MARGQGTPWGPQGCHREGSFSPHPTHGHTGKGDVASTSWPTMRTTDHRLFISYHHLSVHALCVCNIFFVILTLTMTTTCLCIVSSSLNVCTIFSHCNHVIHHPTLSTVCIQSRTACILSRTACIPSRTACIPSRTACILSRTACVLSRTACKWCVVSCPAHTRKHGLGTRVCTDKCIVKAQNASSIVG